MPQVIPGQPIAPGIASGNTYPQYGVGGGSPGSPAGWRVVVAANGAEKMQDISKGFVTWFDSRSAAQNFISSQSSSFGSGETGLSGLSAIGDFFSRLTQANTWIRVGEFAAGLIILYIGLNATLRGTAAGNAVQSAKRTAINAGKLAAK